MPVYALALLTLLHFSFTTHARLDPALEAACNERGLTYDVIERDCVAPEPPPKPAVKRPKYPQIVRSMIHKAKEKITMTVLTDCNGVSTNSLRYAFRREADGQTPTAQFKPIDVYDIDLAPSTKMQCLSDEPKTQTIDIRIPNLKPDSRVALRLNGQYVTYSRKNIEAEPFSQGTKLEPQPDDIGDFNELFDRESYHDSNDKPIGTFR